MSEFARGPTLWARVSSALFYSISSIAIMVINKVVLTTYRFPSPNLLALLQLFLTVIILLASKWAGLVSFPDIELSSIRKIFPLPLLFLGNLTTGLSSTKSLNLPMLTVLRRFSIVMTMILELYILRKHPSLAVQFSVFLMVIGAIVAAMYDLTFDLNGYIVVFLNDAFTAANGVFMKQKLDAKDLGAIGVMFYNSLVCLPLMVVVCLAENKVPEVLEMGLVSDSTFMSLLILSGALGCLVAYSTVLCTQNNSALTTTVVGCLKNIVTSYIGMVTGGDYVFNAMNFLGLNISIVGSVVYSAVTFQPKSAPALPVSAPAGNISGGSSAAGSSGSSSSLGAIAKDETRV